MPFKECESWTYFCAMNNPFVELPDVRFKKMLILFAKRNELRSQNNFSLS